MLDLWKMVAAFLLGSGGLALIDWLRAKWKYKVDRQALKEDRTEAKNDEVEKLTKIVKDMASQQKEQTAQLAALQDALKCVLLDRVIHLGQNYIRVGEIDFDDRRRLREMHHAYHESLGGNGDAAAIMNAVDALPLKNHS